MLNGRAVWAGILKISLIVLFVGFLTAGCATAEAESESAEAVSEIPSWYLNSEAEYPFSRYIVGTASANSSRGARENARAEISRIFSQQIEVDERLEEEYVEMVTDDERSFAEQTRMVGQIQVKSSEELMNVRVGPTECITPAEGWGQTCYALAYLDRRESAGIYRDQIENLIAQVANLYERYQEAEEIFEQLRYIGTAELTAFRTADLKNQLKIIETTRRELPEIIPEPEQIQNERMRLLMGLNVYVEEPVLAGQHSVNGAGDVLESWARRAVNGLGFGLIGESSEADLVVNTTLQLRLVEFDREQVKHLQWDATIAFDHLETGQNLLTVTRNGRAVASTVESATQRMLAEIEQIIKGDFIQQVEREMLRL